MTAVQFGWENTALIIYDLILTRFDELAILFLFGKAEVLSVQLMAEHYANERAVNRKFDESLFTQCKSLDSKMALSAVCTVFGKGMRVLC